MSPLRGSCTHKYIITIMQFLNKSSLLLPPSPHSFSLPPPLLTYYPSLSPSLPLSLSPSLSLSLPPYLPLTNINPSLSPSLHSISLPTLFSLSLPPSLPPSPSFPPPLSSLNHSPPSLPPSLPLYNSIKVPVSIYWCVHG